MADKELKSLITNLAREAVESYIIKKKIPEIKPTHPFLNKKAAAFVCLKINKQLRGCLGTIEPQQNNLASEIIANSIRAATEDYRFSPIQQHELARLDYSIDVLSDITIVKNESDLDPKKYGVIVKQGHNKGLLLPDLEGIRTARQQLDIAKHKAGIFDDKNVEIYKFEVQRF